MKNSEGQNNYIKHIALQLRRNQTRCEAVFWEKVRNRKLNGMKFLRQYPISFEYFGERRFFIADFYCHQARLVVEIDGGIHEFQAEYDRMREQIINRLNLRIIRFQNHEILMNLEDVLEIVSHHLTETLGPVPEKRKESVKRIGEEQ